MLDTKQLAQRLEAGMSSKQAKQLLKDAGILNLPTTLLAYADDLVDPEPAMQLHRGLLPPNHERPERLKVILARLRTTGILGERWQLFALVLCLVSCHQVSSRHVVRVWGAKRV